MDRSGELGINFKVEYFEKFRAAGTDRYLFEMTNPGIAAVAGSAFRFSGKLGFSQSEKGRAMVRETHGDVEPTQAPAGQTRSVDAGKSPAAVAPVTAKPAPSMTASDLSALIQKSVPSSFPAGEPFVSLDGKAKATIPATFAVDKGTGDILAKIVYPSPGNHGITLTNTSVGWFGEKTANAFMRGTLDSLQKDADFPLGSVATDPLPSRLGTLDALTAVFTGIEANGESKRKVITIAIDKKRVLAAILHTTPDSLEAEWPAYRLVCASYASAENK